MRQTLLALIYLLSISGFSLKLRKKEKWIRNFLSYLSLILVFLVPYLRLYRGYHSFLDIGMGLGIAIILFWVVAETLSLMIHPERKHHHQTVQLAAACSFVPWFFYAGDAQWVIPIFLFIFIALGVSERIAPTVHKKLIQLFK